MLRCVNRRIFRRQILPLRMEEMQSANAGFWNFFVDKTFYLYLCKKKYTTKSNTMKKHLLPLLVLFVPLMAWCDTGNHTRKVNQVDFSQLTINDSFWLPRLEKHASATLPVCIDQIENQTGRMQNFINAGKGSGSHSGIFFDDSDVYKAMEGMAYSLVVRPDDNLEAKLDEWVPPRNKTTDT